jgi:hypothetical protein
MSNDGGAPQDRSVGPDWRILRPSETRAVVIVTPSPASFPDGMVCLDRGSPHFRAVESAVAWDESNDPKLMLPLLAGWSSLRKLRLLACAIVRHAPFGPDGRTIWDLVLECG